MCVETRLRRSFIACLFVFKVCILKMGSRIWRFVYFLFVWVWVKMAADLKKDVKYRAPA